mmetsp:Transcript_8901/g.25636  ORF Transcript_8901/g.25636 Transcript_8901/m.25636 type:complete len:87 (-) Transcript_8901:35-295(-)
MSKANIDRCLAHTLLMFMIAQGPQMVISNLIPITKDLKIPPLDATQLLRMAGCVVTKKTMKDGTTVKLKLPLEFPGPRKGGRLKKR